MAQASAAGCIQSACFFQPFPTQVISRTQVLAARRLRAESFPLRAGNARQRAGARWQRISALTSADTYA
jgi:hypothetical protein